VALALFYLSSELAREGRLGFPMDDPYIHFQFARNLAHGAGFSFNPGEPTPGATSPLWVVLLAAGNRLGFPLEPLAIGLGIASAALAACMTFEVGLAAGLPLALAFLAGLALGSAGRFTWASLSGMETCLAAGLSLVLMRLVLSPRRSVPHVVTMGLVAGLCAEARPEMFLLGPLVAVLEWRQTRTIDRPLLFFGAVFLAVLLPYTVFCLVTTGRLLPNTFYAKSLLPLYLPGSDLPTLRLEYMPEMIAWTWRDNLFTGVLLLPGLVMWARRHVPRGSGLVLLWPIAFWIYAIALYPRHFSLSRYTIPLMPALSLIAIAPLEAAGQHLRGIFSRHVVAGAAGLLIALAAASSQPKFRGVYLANIDNILRMQVSMGQWVASHLPRNARVATNDVGAITYYGGRYCIDTVGLVSSDFITHELAWRKAHGSIVFEDAIPSYWARAKPDYCILFPSWYPRLTQQPWLVKIDEIDYPNNTGGGNELVVYRVTGGPRLTP